MGGSGVKPLSRELIVQYDLDVKRYQYIRSNYYLETNKGRFVLRKVDVPKEQITFNYEVDTQLQVDGFEELSHIYVTKRKSPYATIGDQYYMMQEYEPCEETDFKVYKDLKGIIVALSHFHKAAQGIESKMKSAQETRVRNIYEYYSRRKVENTKLKKNMLTLKQKSDFEVMFLEGCEEYRDLEEMALESIDGELVNRLINEVRMTKCIAHKDFTYHTVNKAQNDKYIIAALDQCNYDIQVLDLAQILSKIMQKNEWDIDVLYRLLEAYNRERSLSQDEFKMLKFSIIYPDKFNSICFKYMGSKRRWNYSMFEQKWENMLSYKSNQIEVAKEIKKW